MIFFTPSFRQHLADAFFPRMSEWGAAGMLFALGWMLSANPDLMGGAKSNAYDLMLAMAHQDTWSKIMMGFGGIRLTILMINGYWRRSPHLRALTAFLSCFFWTQIVLSFAPTFGFVFIFACGYLAQDFATIIRAMRDARTVDDAHARGLIGGSK